ncbi:hypothetical protein NPIL_261321 [Nephila pilipes]|uniref:C2H2-type domain-containing protein n=1 Tax=Nephila pilipes TaxID=299642 RepID=A0A8X6TEL1_NEPPI|nr:hypothetical protein NPIL_261321 [Nephila pilipes]
MDYSETSQIETLELGVKEHSLSGPDMMSLRTSDEGMSVKRAKENLEAENECRIQMKNYIEEFMEEEMKHMDSTIHSPLPSTSNSITRGHKRPCYLHDNEREFKKFKSSNLQRSEKVPKKMHSFKPSHCDDSFVNKNFHGRDKVTGDTKCNFQCKTCGKEFTYRSKLKRHELVHTGERRYLCDYCDKACRNSYALKEHVRIHTREKPYLCPQCPEKFSFTSSLYRHKRVHLQE